MTGGGHKIHATDNEGETRHNIAMLLGGSLDQYLAGRPLAWDGHVQMLNADLVGATGWENLRQLFVVLNETISYLVMRNYEWLPDRFSTKEHGDIDILTGSLEEMVFITNAVKVFPEEHRVHYSIQIGGQDVKFDFRYLGDGYYCAAWQEAMLSTRELYNQGFYIPTTKHYFYSLLYHALVHKPVIARDYVERLARLAESLGKSLDTGLLANLMTARSYLDDFLLMQGYEYCRPFDHSVYFNKAFLSDIVNSDSSRAQLEVESGLKRQFGAFKQVALKALQEVEDISLASDELLNKFAGMKGGVWLNYYYCYLSPIRSYLLRPLEANLRGKRVLEFGGEGGALSRYLGELGAMVTMVEGDRELAVIAETRCSDQKNVRVVSQPISEFVTDERFDVVTLIGNLSCCRALFPGPDPVGAMLGHARSFLSDDGVLIVATENKLGLKYWAGAPDEHVGVPFYSIEGLYDDSKAVSFGKHELSRILKRANFGSLEFYYPCPDYKLPAMVLSELVESADPAIANNLLSASFAPSREQDYPRMFSEGAAYRSLVENGLLGHLANSFLVIAKKGQGNWQVNSADLAFTYSQGRRREYSKEVHILRSEKGCLVRRRLLFSKQPHESMKFAAEERLESGETLFNKLLPIVNREGWTMELLASWLRPLYSSLLRESRNKKGRRVLSGRFLDASSFNLIENSEKTVFFDLEWNLWSEIDLNYVLFRGLYQSLARLGSVAQPRRGTILNLAELAAQVVERLVGEKVDIERYLAQEVEFLNKVSLSRFSVDRFKAGRLHVRKQSAGIGSAPSMVKNSQADSLSRQGNTTPADLLENWMGARIPTLVQRCLIREHIKAEGQKPKLIFFVLDLTGNLSELDETIKSLASGNDLCVALKIVVLSVSASLEKLSNEKMEFIKVSKDAYIDLLNRLVVVAGYDWFMLLKAGEKLTPNGLLMASLEILASPNCRAISFDEIYRQDGALGAACRPSFNLDYLLSFPAGMARHWLFQREAVLEMGGFDPSLKDALELDLILRLINQGGMDGLGHISEPLLITDMPALANVEDERQAIIRHLQARGYPDAQVTAAKPGRYHVAYKHVGSPGVSILILAGSQLSKLQRCVEGLLGSTAYQTFEILLIESHPQNQAVHEWLSALVELQEAKLRVVQPASLNMAAMLNQAANEALGDYLLFLAPDAAIVEEDWLDNLLNHAQRAEVGGVGGKLLSPDGKIAQAMQILGLQGPLGNPYVGEKLDEPGYMQRLQVDQNVSALSQDCLMLPRDLYVQLEGLDEEGILSPYSMTDLCLRIREAGYLLVWSPSVQLMLDRQEPAQVTAEQQDAMYAKWLPQLARDPAYNPNFSLAQPGGFKLADTQISWRPLDVWRPLPVVLAHPADTMGCGHYRVMQPFNALREAGMVDGALSVGLMHVVDLERYNPDAVILQRQIGEERLEAMRRIKAFSRAFKVYELDDYLPNLPMKSVHRQHMPKDIVKSLRRGLSYVDRFVVSTEVMAEAFAKFHPDIRVVKNRLDPRWWAGLPVSARRVSKKPRVGWAGGSSHTGDLEMIADVVKELAGEVEWVFFGMCPEKLKPYVHEFHEGVAIERYAKKLASLNLDLALAPVEQNLFNECKSNLRLLEYGACGFPVICSDVRCYQGDGLPVTRVKNRFKDWVEAIRGHINDLDAAARAGGELRAAVLNGWMLEGENLEAWRKAWLAD